MLKTFPRRAPLLIAAFLSVAGSICLAQTGKAVANLAGAWRGKVQFTSGAFAEIKDLEFMYAFNAGGTMTESSNYALLRRIFCCGSRSGTPPDL